MAQVIHWRKLKSLTPPILSPDDTEGLKKSLAENGYAVVKVMEEETATQRFHEFWDWLEGLGSGIDRTKPETWDKKENWPDSIFGMLNSYGIGQADFVWKCRTEPNVLKAFATIWNVPPEDLLSSFDGACLYPSPNDIVPSPTSTSPPPEFDPSKTPLPPIQGSNELEDGHIQLWAHADQSPAEPGFLCIQGQLVLRSNLNPADGGLILYPNTHTIAWKDRYPNSTKYSTHYYRPPNDVPETQPSEAHVCRVPAGSLILWDSRMIHCNCPPQSTEKGAHTRACTYICMMPRSLATPAVLAERIQLHKKHCTTGHWPHELSVNPDGGFFAGSKVTGKDVMLRVRKQEAFGVRDPIVRRLVGYESGEATWMEAVGNSVGSAMERLGLSKAAV
ncbi:hypothetical protein HK097_010771 [Rhizophlyctis rosea]|uniref:Phytanoyl-CoA dioxygenase n=1 Tax=Rhizophlyctis rosea TaxID=64517 RepID=A0AAD5X2X3_9FUNG|nr:hypothetical protein HK097_010771 [Rhizophlyctis rosea]